MGLSGLLARLLHNVSRLKKYSFLIQ